MIFQEILDFQEAHAAHSEALWFFSPAADHDLWHIFKAFLKTVYCTCGWFSVYLIAHVTCVQAPACFYT